MINKVDIRFSCYIIAGKTMRHYMKNECALDAISVAEHCCQGEVLNWSTFVLNELFEACEDVYRRGTSFVFGYILILLEMLKWRPPKEREMATIFEGQPIALCYGPWRASGESSTKEINEITLRDWYEQMISTIRSTETIPKALLDEFSEEVWFRASHTHTYLRPWCVHPEIFKMRSQRFILTETMLHKKVGSWSRVAYEITDGKYNYIFGALKQWAQRGDVAESSRKWPVEDFLHPMVLQMKEKMFELRQTISSFEGQLGESNYPTQFQGSTMFSPIITTSLAMQLPMGVAHSPY